jgi:hypothetical protein
MSITKILSAARKEGERAAHDRIKKALLGKQGTKRTGGLLNKTTGERPTVSRSTRPPVHSSSRLSKSDKEELEIFAQEQAQLKARASKQNMSKSERLNRASESLHSATDHALHHIATGKTKFQWESLSNETGFRTGERKKMLWLLNSNGYTVAGFAHKIWEDMEGHSRDIDDQDVLNDVIGVLTAVESPAHALEWLEERQEGLGDLGFIRMPNKFKYFTFNSSTTIADVQSRYRQLCKTHHPDKGGSNAIQAEINSEYEAIRHFGIEQAYSVATGKSKGGATTKRTATSDDDDDVFSKKYRNKVYADAKARWEEKQMYLVCDRIMENRKYHANVRDAWFDLFKTRVELNKEIDIFDYIKQKKEKHRSRYNTFGERFWWSLKSDLDKIYFDEMRSGRLTIGGLFDDIVFLINKARTEIIEIQQKLGHKITDFVDAKDEFLRNVRWESDYAYHGKIDVSFISELRPFYENCKDFSILEKLRSELKNVSKKPTVSTKSNFFDTKKPVAKKPAIKKPAAPKKSPAKTYAEGHPHYFASDGKANLFQANQGMFGIKPFKSMTVKERYEFIRDFYNLWKVANPEQKIFNRALGKDIHVVKVSKKETANYASKSSKSTEAVTYLTEILENAIIVSRNNDPKSITSKRYFVNMVEMRYVKKGFGTIKLTVGERDGGKSDQYCILDITDIVAT